MTATSVEKRFRAHSLVRSGPEKLPAHVTRCAKAMTNPNLDLGLTIMQRARREMQALSLADGPSHPGSALIIDPAASAAQLVQDAMRHSQNGDPALAHLHWQAACVLAPDNKVAALRLAQSLLPLTGPRATCDALQALVERYPDFVPARLGLASHLSGTKDYSLALQETETILQAAPDNPVALIIRANCLRQLRRDAEAVQALTRAMQSNPDIPSPRLKLAGLLFELGRFVDVVALCGDAAPTDIRPLALHVFAARAQFRLGQRADAARRFSDLILACPSSVYPEVSFCG